MKKFAIVGCGLIARSHTEAIRNITSAELVAVADVKEEIAEKLAKEENVKAYTDVEKMLDETKPDAVIICVPTFVHESYVKMCAERGIHVLCEKPMEKTGAMCKEIIDHVKKSGIIYQTAQVVRFWPGYTMIKDMFDNNELGQVYMMRLRRVSSRAGQYGAWLFRPELGGGALFDMLVHDVDYLRYVAGPFESCYANAVKDETGCYNNVMANIICHNGIHAVCETSFTMATDYPFSFSVSIVGTKATVEYSYSAGATIAERNSSKTSFNIWRMGKGKQDIKVEEYDPYKKQLEYFIRCLEDHKQPEIITPEQSLEVIETINALQKSADEQIIVNM